MHFYKHPGLIGQVYTPRVSRKSGTKHSCPDCFNCQGCGNDRCNLCLARENTSDEFQGALKKESMGEGKPPDTLQ